jgi:predicted DNA binding protein
MRRTSHAERQRTARGEEYAVVKMETTVPPVVWYSALSRKFPDLRFDISNDINLADHAVLVEVTVRGTDQDLSKQIRLFPEVQNVESVPIQRGVRMYRVVFRNPWQRRVVSDLRLIIRFPRTLRNGTITFDALARMSQVRALVRQLRSMGFSIRVLSVRRSLEVPPARPLTRIQEQRFREAVELGYFDVPRRISLKELARRVSRSPSSVSRILAEVERKLADWGTANL